MIDMQATLRVNWIRLRLLFALLLVAGTVSSGATISAQEASVSDLAQRAFSVLKQNCYRCHGQTFQGNPQFNVLDREVLVDEDHGYLVTGDPQSSFLWERVVSGDMPPEGQPPMTEEDQQVLRQWILEGAPFPVRQERPLITEGEILEYIRDDLSALPTDETGSKRYFTLAHLSNNARVTEHDLRMYRAALSKAVNSLTRQTEIIVPTPIDPGKTIFRIDLVQLDWKDRDVWKRLLRNYPYGLSHDRSGRPELRDLSRDDTHLLTVDLAYLRPDWFVATATVPPLYHEILDIPETSGELEQELDVDIQQNFLDATLTRAGFAQSGVSTQNRLVDRHLSRHGAYWISYDFARDDETSNIFSFPLGPTFDENPFAQHAFEHDGGEIIFHLPNGLMGYMLVDKDGQRIDEAPINIVSDALRTNGSPIVTNGISCMACHRHGTRQFRDTVRNGSGVFGTAREKVQQLFVPQEQMEALLEEDRQQFVTALAQCVGPFLQIDDDQQTDIHEFAEPISAIARLYHANLSATEAALEAGLGDVVRLQAAIQTNSSLRLLGLGPLASDGTVTRDLWSSTARGISTMQETTFALDLGTPMVHTAADP